MGLIEHRMNCDSQSFIGAWYLENSSICDELIEFFDQNEDLYVPGQYSNNVNVNLKNSLDCRLEYTDPSLRKEYYQQLQKVLELYKEKYVYCDVLCDYWGIVEKGNFQKYKPGGGFYSWHTERNSANVPFTYRHLVYMTYLNDVTDDGETEFFYQKVKVQPRKGLTLIWPADWTHTHRGITSPTQTKYIVTGWYSFISRDA